MIQRFYENFGFFGALFLSGFLFVLFVLWLAGLAGITVPFDGGKLRHNKWQIFVSVLVPIYPILWIIKETIVHKRDMAKK